MTPLARSIPHDDDRLQRDRLDRLARLILAHDLTQRYVPSEHRLYPDPPYLYDECHPDCIGCLGGNDETSS